MFDHELPAAPHNLHDARRRERRRLLATAAAALCALLLLLPSRGRANQVSRRLAFVHVHTGETLSTVYAEGDTYVPEALAAIDRLLRDQRTGDIHPMDPRCSISWQRCRL
jgi:uncharacterized protein YcbK (DUF882 family)